MKYIFNLYYCSDPDFWSKWAKKANIDVGVLHDDYSTKHLIIHEPRARKKRFEEEIESADDGVSDDGMIFVFITFSTFFR